MPDGKAAHPLLHISHPPSDIRHLYIHTPFCVHKCHYCDFYSFVDTRDQQTAFVDRLIDELRSLAPHAGVLDTIFVGGGTPSLLRIDLWQRVLAALNDLFDLSTIRRPWIAEHADPWRPVTRGEFTVECNPESAVPPPSGSAEGGADLMHVLAAGGVNRVSIGAQSFHSHHLKTLERWHNPDNVARAIEAARAAGIDRQSVDLIFAIPGQTIEEWDSDLRRALALNTTHLSCYNLTYEPNTAMTKRLSLGEFAPISEELEEEMFTHTVRTLRAAGLDRYEVSNFARPGHESRHNIAYWIQAAWLAAGPSASGHLLDVGCGMSDVGCSKPSASPASLSSHPTFDIPHPTSSWRFKNVPRLGDYLASTGLSPVTDVESPDPLRLIRERVMMGLRLQAGLDVSALLNDLESLAPGAPARLQRAAAKPEAAGHLTMTSTRWTLTDAGFLFCDGIAASLMESVS